MKRLLVTACVVLLAVACTTRPASTSVLNSRAYQKPYDAVWQDIVEYLATNNIQVKNIAKDSGVIYAERTAFDPRLADCGKLGLMRLIGNRAHFNIFVNRTGLHPTVTVNTEFILILEFYGQREEWRCQSNGVIEAAILNAVKL